MSIVPKETIEVIAQSIGISNLSQDMLPALAADVEYRVREIMQVIIHKVTLSRSVKFDFCADYEVFNCEFCCRKRSNACGIRGELL